MISIKNLGLNNVKIVKKIGQKYSYFLQWLCSIKIVNALYFIINKIKGYIQEHNGNKYVTLAHADERKDTLKKV